MATTQLSRPPDTGRFALPPEFTARPRQPVALTWIATRSAMMVVLGLFGGPVTGDVLYYGRSLHGMFSGGSVRETLQEYPIPVLGVMLPVFLIRRGGRGVIVGWFVLICAALGTVSLAAGGAGRLISPLRWQGARGLQIESVVATPLMIARSLHPHHVWKVRTSQYKSTELFGAGVHAMLTVLTIATVAGLAVLVWLWFRTASTRDAPLVTLGWLILASATVITIVNKTLSPQYIIWLGGPLAALMVFAPRDATVRRAAQVLIGLS